MGAAMMWLQETLLRWQKIVSSRGAPQPAARTTSSVTLRIGCIYKGIHQDMLKLDNHIENGRRILGQGFEEGELHVLGFCEVGGHKQGLNAADINPQKLIDEVLPNKEYRAEAIHAYMSVWHEAGAAQRGGVPLQLSGDPSCHELSDKTPQAQLVTLDFHVTARGHEGEVGRLVQGL